MKILAISQRVENITQYKEQRDCLDQRWTLLAHHLGFIAVPLPNLATPADIINTIKPAAIVLSGGNSITKLDPTASDISPIRDKFEQELLQLAIDNNLPVLGVCRGMQLINLFFGGELAKVSGHIACRHQVDFIDGGFKDKNMLSDAREVNSFHQWGISESQLAKSLQSFAIAQDKTIEGFHHNKLPIAGMMWHPEREQPYDQHDHQLMKKFLL